MESGTGLLAEVKRGATMTTWIDDRKLVESYREGDESAFAELVHTHHASLMSHARRRLYDPGAAEDAVQETYVRAFRALPDFDGDYRLGPWLHRILSNVCADEGNRRRREAEKVDRVIAQPAMRDKAPGVESTLGLDIDVGLEKAMASLPETYREALELRFLDDLTYDEMAATAGVTKQNARARVSRARDAVRVALRGVAAFPLLLLGLTRRGEKAVAAATRSNAAGLSTQAATASPVANALAPTAEAVSVAGPTIALATKAAIGITFAVTAVVPSSAPVDKPTGQPSAPISAPAATDTTTTEQAADAGSNSALAAPAQPTDAAPAADTTQASADSGQAATSTNTGGNASTRTPASTAPPTSTPTTDGPAPTEPAPDPVVQRKGGALSANGLAVTPAGPRFDVSGPVSLTVGGATFSGTISGRFAIPEGDATTPRRFSATLDLKLGNGEVVTVRLAGHATPVGATPVPATDSGEEPAPVVVTSFTMSGQVSATSSETIALIEGGSFSGSLDANAGSLTLSLS